MKTQITFAANQLVLIKQLMNTNELNLNHLNTFDNANQFKLLSFFKTTVINKVSKGYNVATVTRATQGANDLTEQEAIADASRCWINRCHVYNAISNFKKSHLNIHQQDRLKR